MLLIDPRSRCTEGNTVAEDLIHTSGPPGAKPTVAPLSPPGYELLDEIGRGGMGVVYRARDTGLDRDVAVKLLPERYAPDSVPAHRFLGEARITGQLQHPGIPAVHQVGTLADGRPFLAMKLIKGNTLETILKYPLDPSADRGPAAAGWPSSSRSARPSATPTPTGLSTAISSPPT